MQQRLGHVTTKKLISIPNIDHPNIFRPIELEIGNLHIEFHTTLVSVRCQTHNYNWKHCKGWILEVFEYQARTLDSTRMLPSKWALTPLPTMLQAAAQWLDMPEINRMWLMPTPQKRPNGLVREWQSYASQVTWMGRAYKPQVGPTMLQVGAELWHRCSPRPLGSCEACATAGHLEW